MPISKSEILFEWVEPKYESDYGLKDIKYSLKPLSVNLAIIAPLLLGMVWFSIFKFGFPAFLDSSLSDIRLMLHCIIFALPLAIYGIIHMISVVPYLLKKLDLKTETKFQITSTSFECCLLKELGPQALSFDEIKSFCFMHARGVDQVLELYFALKEEREIKIGGIEHTKAEELKAVLQGQIGLQYIERTENV
jgi:hypothetical protein